MATFALERIRDGGPMAGLFVVRQEGASIQVWERTCCCNRSSRVAPDPLRSSAMRSGMRHPSIERLQRVTVVVGCLEFYLEARSV
jgi:hypothetical protein